MLLLLGRSRKLYRYVSFYLLDKNDLISTSTSRSCFHTIIEYYTEILVLISLEAFGVFLATLHAVRSSMSETKLHPVKVISTELSIILPVILKNERVSLFVLGTI